MATCEFISLLWYNVAIIKYCSVAVELTSLYTWSLIIFLWNQNKNLFLCGYKVERMTGLDLSIDMV